MAKKTTKGHIKKIKTATPAPTTREPGMGGGCVPIR